MRKPESVAGFPSALFAALVLFVAAGCARAPALSPAVSGRWPTARWDTASPESQGIDSSVLIELLAFAARRDFGVHDILIVRHGVLVFDAVFYPYDGENPARRRFGHQIGYYDASGGLRSTRANWIASIDLLQHCCAESGLR